MCVLKKKLLKVRSPLRSSIQQHSGAKAEARYPALPEADKSAPERQQIMKKAASKKDITPLKEVPKQVVKKNPTALNDQQIKFLKAQHMNLAQ